MNVAHLKATSDSEIPVDETKQDFTKTMGVPGMFQKYMDRFLTGWWLNQPI